MGVGVGWGRGPYEHYEHSFVRVSWDRSTTFEELCLLFSFLNINYIYGHYGLSQYCWQIYVYSAYLSPFFQTLNRVHIFHF